MSPSALTYVRAFVTMLSVLVSACISPGNGRDYQERYCRETEDGAVVAFASTDGKSGRHFSINRADSTVLVKIVNAKGIVKWDQIKRLKHAHFPGGRGLLKFRFNEPMGLLMKEKVLFLDFGIISDECWELIVQAFDDTVTTERLSLLIGSTSQAA